MWQTNLLWFFYRRRYFHLHANKRWRSRSISQRRKQHVHTEIPIITFPPPITIPNRESIPLAPLEIRDAIFQELIRMSLASIIERNLSAAEKVYFHEDSSQSKQPNTVHCLRQKENAQVSRGTRVATCVTIFPSTPNGIQEQGLSVCEHFGKTIARWSTFGNHVTI